MSSFATLKQRRGEKLDRCKSCGIPKVSSYPLWFVILFVRNETTKFRLPFILLFSSYASSDRYFARCCDMLWIFKISKSWGRISLIRCYRVASREIAVFLGREKRDSIFSSLSPFMNLPESLHLSRDFSRKFFIEQIFCAGEMLGFKLLEYIIF